MGLIKKFMSVLMFASLSLYFSALMTTDATGAEPDLSISEGEGQGESTADPGPELYLPGIRMLDTSHSYFSKNIEGLSDTVDSFFGDDRIFEETSGTYVQFRGSVIFGKSGERTFDGRIRAKISLDNLNDRVQLQLYGEDDSVEPGTVLSGGELDDTLNDLDPAVSLQFVLLEQKRWDIRLRPGIKFRSPIDPFLKVRFRRQQRLGERWLWRTTFYPGWYDSRGYELPVTIDFERGTGGGGLFRSSSSGIWREEDPANLFLQETLLFTHPFGRSNQLAYTAGVGFEREPRWRDSLYFATVRFRRNIHHGWIFFEVTPQVLFARTSNFKAEPSLVFTLEMFFGGAYLK
jgi:hypothetical protein